jgi:hypothetical protein
MAQPDPQNFHIIYGNRDGSPMIVHLGEIIEVQIWGATAPVGPDLADTVTFLHDPLASNDTIVTHRFGGYGRMDCEDTFSAPEHDITLPPWYTSQSHMFFAYLHDPRTYDCILWTEGDTVWVAAFRMQVTSDSSYLGRTVCPFMQGHSSPHGDLLWGMGDGVNGVIPVQTYGCLRFERYPFIPSDANGDSVFNGLDVNYCVNYFCGRAPHPPLILDCGQYGSVFAAADANGNCIFNAMDVTYGVNFLKSRGPAPQRCPSCP